MSREELHTSDKATAPDAEMTFWEHVESLRGVVLKSIVVWVAITIAMFAFMPQIFDNVILAPCRGDFCTYRLLELLSTQWPGMDVESVNNFSIELINIELASQFFIHISTACWLAFALSVPAILYFLWQFVSPALYPRERRGGVAAFTMGCAMFAVGAAVGYFVVFPLTVRFLSGYQLSAEVPNIISLTSYTDTFMSIILVMGLLFELPLLAWILGRFGLLTRAFFNRYRRHAVVVLLILAAIVTPTGDPFTLFAVFIPVYLVWEAGALLVPKH